MIPQALITKFGPTGAKAVFFGGIVLALMLVGLVLYLTGRSDGKQGEVLDQLEREVEVQGEVGRANEGSAVRQAQDEVRVALNQKELHDALQTTTDSDTRRVLRGCIIMRQQGRDTSNLAPCVRFESRP